MIFNSNQRTLGNSIGWINAGMDGVRQPFAWPIKENTQAVALTKRQIRLTKYAPQVTATANNRIALTARSLLITKKPLQVTATAHGFIGLPRRQLFITKQAISVGLSDLKRISLPLRALNITRKVPQVTTTANVRVGLPLKALLLTRHAFQVNVEVSPIVIRLGSIPLLLTRKGVKSYVFRKAGGMASPFSAVDRSGGFTAANRGTGFNTKG